MQHNWPHVMTNAVLIQHNQPFFLFVAYSVNETFVHYIHKCYCGITIWHDSFVRTFRNVLTNTAALRSFNKRGLHLVTLYEKIFRLKIFDLS